MGDRVGGGPSWDRRVPYPLRLRVQQRPPVEGEYTTHIVITIVTAIVGATLLAAGIRGFALRQLNTLQRFIILAVGLLLIAPRASTRRLSGWPTRWQPWCRE
ncbi:MAG: hypothetical protein QGG48_07965 [Desulfatiglandales bacterium]|nr:hypothetical protein [Desulfatiglandales bacterium]